MNSFSLEQIEFWLYESLTTDCLDADTLPGLNEWCKEYTQRERNKKIMRCKLCNPIKCDEKVISRTFCEKCWAEFNEWLNVGNKKNINKPENCKFCGKYKFLHKSHSYSCICIECLGDKFCSKYQKGETDAIENKETSQTNGGSRT